MQLKPFALFLSSIMCVHTVIASNQPQPVMSPQANTNSQAILDYWTPERMQEATPMDLPMVNQNSATQIPVDVMMQKYKGQTQTIYYGAPPTIKVTPDTRQKIKPRTSE